MKTVTISLALLLFILSPLAWSEENHDHKHTGKNAHQDTRTNDGHKRDREHESHDKHDDHDAHGDHADHEEHHHEDQSVGTDKAIIASESEGNRFKLSNEALSALGIQTATIAPAEKDTFIVPNSAVVRFQEHTGVFILRGGWFQLVEGPIKQSRSTGKMNFISDEVTANDQVVISGTALLRIAHLQASGQGGKGHAH